MTERWAPVLGYEGLYEVSDHGQVRSLGRFIRSRGNGRSWRDGVVLRQKTNDDGYREVTLCRDGKQRSCQVHRLVLEAFVGPCPDGMQCCHYPDRNRANNRPGNLRWGTAADNQRDQVEHGTARHSFGEEHPGRRLSCDSVRLIWSLLARGERQRVVAERFGVSASTIQAVANGRTWSHVTLEGGQ